MTAEEAAGRWGVSVRRVRNYCAGGFVAGALRSGGRWRIPEDAVKPCRSRAASAPRSALLEALRREKAAGLSGGIYHKVQIELTYNSNHIEGGSLTHDQTRYIFETDTIAAEGVALRVDDVVETANKLHLVLKNGTSDSRRSWFAAGGYKRLPNEVGGVETAPPEETAARMRELLASYEKVRERELDDLLDFHYRFERIHPFQDGNGRVGRLILFKECLRSGVVPFIITDELRMFYYRGLSEWERLGSIISEFHTDLCAKRDARSCGRPVNFCFFTASRLFSAVLSALCRAALF